MVFSAIAVATATAFAPTAGAAPQCINTTPTTTQCQTPGHSQIVTSPPAMNDDYSGLYGGYLIGPFRR